MAQSDRHVSERDLIDKLLATLRELPGVDAQAQAHVTHSPYRDRGIDAEVRFDAGGKNYVLIVEVKKSVYPRDAQQVLWQLNRYLGAESGKDRKNFVPLLAAESISPGAKDLLKHENFGYFDTGGSLFIPARGAYFYVDKPPPKTLEKSVRSLFKGKRSQVIHALLMRHKDWFGVKELAELAEVSPATTSETLTEIERFEWLTARGQGPSKERRLTEPGALLDEWRKQITTAVGRISYRRYFVPGTDVKSLTERVAKLCETHQAEYVLTQEAAAQFYAPFLSTISRVTCRIVPGQPADQAIGELGARVVSEGANFDVIETKTHGEFLFKERKDSVWLASPVQVYLDLLRGGGRSMEMAEHLRRERIGF